MEEGGGGRRRDATTGTYLTDIANPGRFFLHSQRVQVDDFGGTDLLLDYELEIVVLGAGDERLQRLHFAYGCLATFASHVGATRLAGVRATGRRCDRTNRVRVTVVVAPAPAPSMRVHRAPGHAYRPPAASLTIFFGLRFARIFD